MRCFSGQAEPWPLRRPICRIVLAHACQLLDLSPLGTMQVLNVGEVLSSRRAFALSVFDFVGSTFKGSRPEGQPVFAREARCGPWVFVPVVLFGCDMVLETERF